MRSGTGQGRPSVWSAEGRAGQATTDQMLQHVVLCAVTSTLITGMPGSRHRSSTPSYSDCKPYPGTTLSHSLSTHNLLQIPYPHEAAEQQSPSHGSKREMEWREREEDSRAEEDGRWMTMTLSDITLAHWCDCGAKHSRQVAYRI